MIALDTSGLLAAIDGSQRSHDQARRALESDRGPFLLSPFVLAELDYLLRSRVGIRAELDLLDDVVGGSYRLEPFETEDLEQARSVIGRYVDLDLGLADASIVVLCARSRTDRVLTLDERHFRAIRTIAGRPFTLLP